MRRKWTQRNSAKSQSAYLGIAAECSSRMSLCDHCFAPGQCCRQITFYGGEGETSDPSNERTWWLDEPIEPQLRDGMHQEEDANRPIPFEIDTVTKVWTVDNIASEDTDRPYGHIIFKCRNLLPNGRCGDYDNRPWLCRQFEPASDRLCVHYRGAEGGEG